MWRKSCSQERASPTASLANGLVVPRASSPFLLQLLMCPCAEIYGQHHLTPRACRDGAAPPADNKHCPISLRLHGARRAAALGAPSAALPSSCVLLAAAAIPSLCSESQWHVEPFDPCPVSERRQPAEHMDAEQATRWLWVPQQSDLCSVEDVK